MYTKEQLVGRSFRAAPEGTGQLNYIHDTTVDGYVLVKSLLIPDHKPGKEANWSVAKLSQYFAEGSWKLLPEEPKMYKTPKGIEYGVGTKFTYKPNEDYVSSSYVVNAIIDGNVRWSEEGSNFNTEQTKKEFEYHLDDTAPYNWVIIQDTLNNQMKEVIEVGDTVHSKMFPGTDHVIKSIDGKILWFESGTWLSVDAVNLVSKANKQEIVGYELLKDLPGIPKGSKTTDHNTLSTGGFLFKVGDNIITITHNQVGDTTWFKPIYKAQDIKLAFSKYNATLSKEHGLVFTDNERLGFTTLSSLVAQLEVLNGNTNLGIVGAYSVNVKSEITELQVGCKSFTPDDIKLITEAVKSLR